MSKMRMPEMSVVRFEESDVICASLYTVSGATDTTGWNLTVKRPDGRTIFRNSNTDPGVDEMGSYGGNGVLFYYSDSTNAYSLYDLTVNDSRNPGTSLPNVDGSYTWDGYKFDKYNQ